MQFSACNYNAISINQSVFIYRNKQVPYSTTVVDRTVRPKHSLTTAL